VRGNVSLFPLLLLPYRFAMSRRTSVGMGYSHSLMNRSLWNVCASNILTQLASQSVTGHSPPIRVHQHYCLEFHLVLAGDSCIRRGIGHAKPCTNSPLSSKDVWRDRVPVHSMRTVCCMTKSNSLRGPHLRQTDLGHRVTVNCVRDPI